MTMNAKKIFGVTAITAGLVLAISAPAGATMPQTPTVTATPSSGLPDEAVVATTISGFAADASVYVAQCAQPADVLVCHEASIQPVTTDAGGAGAAAVTVNSTFVGKILDGTEWGTVDCKTIAGGCYVVAADDAIATTARAAIAFS